MNDKALSDNTLSGKKLLVVGASTLQLPAVIAAKEMELYVAVADRDPTSVAIPYADRYYNVSTVDCEGIYEAAKDLGADGVMTLATDMPMRAVAYACERLGLCCIDSETAYRATDKGAMLRAFEAHGLAHPRYRIFKNANDAVNSRDILPYPCICKPIDSSGSRGVSLVESPRELETAAERAATFSRAGEVILIEEYLRGSEVSVETVVWQGEASVIAVTDKLTSGAPHFVELGHSQPSMLPEKVLDNVKSLAVNAVKAVGIDNGTAHVEIMVTEHGAKLIELGARLGGDCIASHLVPLSTGTDMVRAAIDISLRRAPELERRFSKGAAIRYLPTGDGLIADVLGTDDALKLPGVCELTLTKRPGDRLCGLTCSGDRPGYVIAQASDAAKAADICTEAISKIVVRYATEGGTDRACPCRGT